ncbi:MULTISPECIES: KEOPS complex subunit Pcc1 [Halobacterium]|uniref:KEOPS complex subunit Pcc1 n=4 Tax=Halobacterium salinarum TaxID=2242 RepID=A0A510N484_HALSA|nr:MULTISPECIES: KEOPS complex subunit Pcc1 [Halobacterium]MBB6090675.1 KEOPS complex subunit Pcc1 [Halobacterium salinarum]MCF2164244.1 rpo operon protein [Halobacterium salinarum]MCF2166770.1 rpo operon protein [Halobacterium salinarum]MCF2207159.1 rpo operon protein [Halobacterium salinarum]MCF2237907.1 rpo operon protein [Halobacterium salinarum]
MPSHSTELVFRYDSTAVASIVASSVAVSAGDIDGERSRATVSRDGATVTVVVDATDLTALRAGQNTWLTLVEVAERAAAPSAAGP